MTENRQTDRMNNLNLFTHPATFRRIQTEHLHAWLWPWREYLAERGFSIPATAANWAVDYDRLASIFMEPDAGMPRPLMHSASLIHEMANEDAMLALLDGIRMERLELNVGDDPDPADVAVQVWLADPDLLEELHNLHQLDRPRAFVHFTTDRNPVPAFSEPSDVTLTGLETELAEWNLKAKRGRNARVWVYRRPGEYWFLMKHGLSSRRLEVTSATGWETVIQRPGEYDVLAYNCDRGELRIHACNPKEVEMLRRAFGAHLFGDSEFFPGGAKFTLAPLVTLGRGCLACGDVPELANISLTGVQFFSGGNDWLRETCEAPDLFSKIEGGAVRLPAPELLVRATFLVRFKDSKKRRTVTIAGSNRLKVVRDSDTVLVERWLAARGFVLESVSNEIENGTLASV